jgi:ubiquinone/menaquinone biosynthesis C-methylase UbiE
MGQDMAVELPHCTVTGVDTCPIFPTVIKPVNAYFKQVNDIYNLPFASETFSLINVSSKLVRMSPKQIDIFIGELARICKTNGYMTFMEPDFDFQYTDERVNRYMQLGNCRRS